MHENVVERFPVTLPNGERWDGLLIRTHRPQGRRIQIRSRKGVVLFDSQDCFDAANAMSKLDEWLTEVVQNIRPLPSLEEDTAELPALAVA